MESKIILGIDLGTSNSAAALIIGETPKMVEPAEGPTSEGTVFPSYVAFDSQGSFLYAGLLARNQPSDLVVRHFKRLIGRPFDFVAKEIQEGKRFLDEFKDRIERGPHGETRIKIGPERFTLQDVAGFLLKKIKEDAELLAQSNFGRGIDGVIITIPAGFDPDQETATMEAGEEVFGKGCVKLIEEPLAAAIARGIERDNETFMVVDIGAGTTDVVVGNAIRTRLFSIDSEVTFLDGLDAGTLLYIGTISEALKAKFSDERIDLDPDNDTVLVENTGSEWVITDVSDNKTYLVRKEGNRLNVYRNEFRFTASTKSCDDQLGGWDMDYLILEHLFKTDQNEPYLRDVYLQLDARARGQLMAAIETAKIQASRTGTGVISVILRFKRGQQEVPKLVSYTLEEAKLAEIVAPVINRCQKLVRDTLLEMTDEPERFDEVIRSIDSVILVGGPMLMRCMYEMMHKFAFKEGALREFDPLDSFPMECVAKGAALSEGVNKVGVPSYSMGVLSYAHGFVPLIDKGTPYDYGEVVRGDGTLLWEGTHSLFLLTKKANVEKPYYSLARYMVSFSQKGELNITVDWNLGDYHVSFAGAGIQQITFPGIDDHLILGTHFANLTKPNLNDMRNIRHIKNVVPGLFIMAYVAPKDPIIHIKILTGQVAEDEILRNWMWEGESIWELLNNLSENDMKICEAIDPEAQAELTEEELKSILADGYFSALSSILERRGVSKQAQKVMRLYMSIIPPIPPPLLEEVIDDVIDTAQRAGFPSAELDELRTLRGQLPGDAEVRSNTIMCASKILAVLFKRDAITNEEYHKFLHRLYWSAD